MVNNRTRRGVWLFLALLISLVAIVLLSTEIFQVENITVLGSNTVDKNVIIGMSGVSRGDNIFKISKDTLKQRIQENPPYLIVKSIAFKLPDEVVIAVEERVAVAIIPYLSSHIFIDMKGFILDIKKQSSVTTLPVIQGIRIQSLAKGKTLEVLEHDNYKLRVLYRVLESVYDSGVEQVVSVIYMEDPMALTLTTKDQITVTMGQATDLNKKMAWLRSDAYSEILAANRPGTMDVSVPGKAVFQPKIQIDEVED